MQKIKLLFAVVFLYSCQSGKNIFKTEVVPLSKNDKRYFQNNCYKQDRSSLKRINYNVNLKSLTITGLLGITSPNISDTISFFLNNVGQLQINYTDSSVSKTLCLNGKYTRRGYYQYYVYRKVIEIPPIISFIYGKREIDRLRFGFTKSGDLVIENKYVTRANILIYGGSGDYKLVFYYKSKIN